MWERRGAREGRRADSEQEELGAAGGQAGQGGWHGKALDLLSGPPPLPSDLLPQAGGWSQQDLWAS